MDKYDNHSYFFYIAKDDQGIKNLNYGTNYKEHLIEIPIKYQDINNSWNLIFALNEELSLLIDIYEDEIIDVMMLPKALEISEYIISKEINADKVVSMSIFVSVIKMAIEHCSPLLICW